MKTIEQELREILEQMEIPGALDFSSGELVFLAEYVSDATKRGINIGLERAAAECEKIGDIDNISTGAECSCDCAKAIRAIKVKE